MKCLQTVSSASVWRRVIVSAALVTVALAVPALAAPPDAWITTKVKLALMTTEGVPSTAINVDTVNGQVTLHGKVNSAEAKEKAEAETKKIDGVQSVRNLLQTVPAQHEKAVRQSDDQIKKQVARSLKNDASLKNSSITVQSVNNGVVLLAGSAQTLTDHLSAVEDAASVSGVRRVASEVQSPDKVGDAEIWREHAMQKTSKATRSVGRGAQDLWITSATKMRLLADRKTPALDINVDTRAGVVTLFGMVTSQDAKANAEMDARKVSGVKRVVNELQVVPSQKQETVKAKDDELEREVKKAFENHQDLKDINVQVKNCVARLTGTVPHGTDRLEAAVVARSTHGVCSVQDDLRIAN